MNCTATAASPVSPRSRGTSTPAVPLEPAHRGPTQTSARLAGILLLMICLPLIGCDDQTLGPQKQGTIRGDVRDAESNAPVEGANVTTSPPTQSVLTDEDGMFEFTNVETGSYSVSVTKDGYRERSVSVQVQEGDVSDAAIVLQRSDSFGGEDDSLTAEVTSWFNDRINRDGSGPDSVFVEIEYRARNPGDLLLTRYEVYFSIEAPENTFSYEVHGDSLASGETDIGTFRKYIRDGDADRVFVDGVYVETE